ncbi:hypothetical protein [Jiulongibacter sp. NS-SX5]|uniref:hypothetical protein n=1 Tax=Jiulongibacter sp. NS-SX5 TaxID=3463854 RepID=UPI004059096F
MYKVTKVVLIGMAVALSSCCKTEKRFKGQALLDSLNAGTKDYGSPEVNQAKIRQLNYQKEFNLGEDNGVVIQKDFLTSGVNGFTEDGINMPLDSSNYDRWDFLVVYPGLEIRGEEKALKPVVLYYKGELNGRGILTPSGDPVLVPGPGGGGGPGHPHNTTPPPH